MAENEQQTNLAETFNAFAKKAVEDFPELEGKFVIYNARTNTLHGSFDSADEAALLESQQHALDDFKRENGEYYDSAAFATTFKEYHIINYIGRKEGAPSDYNSDEEEIAELFPHELGHIVAPHGIDMCRGENFVECIADAFSILYPEQRRPLPLVLQGASAINDIRHFSSPVLKELSRLMEKYDLSNIQKSPLQAANLAYRASLFYALPPKQLQGISDAFEPVRQAMSKAETTGYFPAMLACIKVILGDDGKNSPVVFMAGKAWLSQFLDEAEKEEWRSNHQPPAFWDSLRKKIKESTPQEETQESLEQRIAREAKDMMVLGRFDQYPSKKINPKMYETKENIAYLQSAMGAYITLRQQQPAMSQEQTIVRARKMAEKPVSSNPRRKIQAAI